MSTRPKMGSVYISLGSTCGVAYQLQKINPVRLYLPFDWVKTVKFASIRTILEEGFESFGSHDKLTLVRDSDKHPVLKDADDDINQLENFRSGTSKSFVYENQELSITFFHDFDLDDCYPQFKEKYQRRFNRLYETLQSGSHIIFIRDEHKPHNLTAESIDDLVSWLKSNVKGTFELRIIINNPKGKTFTFQDSTEVKFYYDSDKVTDWMRNNLIWDEILKL